MNQTWNSLHKAWLGIHWKASGLSRHHHVYTLDQFQCLNKQQLEWIGGRFKVSYLAHKDNTYVLAQFLLIHSINVLVETSKINESSSGESWVTNDGWSPMSDELQSASDKQQFLSDERQFLSDERPPTINEGEAMSCGQWAVSSEWTMNNKQLLTNN